MPRENIGLLGGTFNPIHCGHIAMANAAAKEMHLNRLIFMPTGRPPHKELTDDPGPAHRLNMCRLATKDLPSFEVSDIEIKRGGASYTVDTLRQLKNQYPDSNLYLIMGADMFTTLDTWREWESILNMAEICAAARGDMHTKHLEAFMQILKQKHENPRVHLITMPAINISSSEIRHKIYCEDDVSGLVPGCVKRYIDDNRLYKR